MLVDSRAQHKPEGVHERNSREGSLGASVQLSSPLIISPVPWFRTTLGDGPALNFWVVSPVRKLHTREAGRLNDPVQTSLLLAACKGKRLLVITSASTDGIYSKLAFPVTKSSRTSGVDMYSYRIHLTAWRPSMFAVCDHLSRAVRVTQGDDVR